MKRKIVVVLLLLISSGILFICYSYLESRWIRTNKIEIQSNDISDSFAGLKIVFITDIHHGPYFSQNRVKKLVKRINKLEPDIIIMGGDYVHRGTKYIKPVFDELLQLEANLGIYAVLGNHDHWENAELAEKLMIRNEIKICDNKSYWVKYKKDSIKIGGVGDLWEDVQLINNTISDIRKSDFCILISHNPDFIEQIKNNKIDLTLSGHTHGGQLTLFGLWAPILPSKYWISTVAV